MSVRKRLFLLVLCAVLPCVVGMAWVLGEAYLRERDSVERSIRETTRAMARVVAGELAAREAVGRTLAESPALRQGDWAVFHAEAAAATRRLNGWVVVVDGERMLVNTRQAFGTPLPPRAAVTRQQRRADNPDGALALPLLQGPVAGEPTTAVVVPARTDAPGAALEIAVVLPPRDLLNVIESQRLPAGWVASVVDQTGHVIARRPNHDMWSGKPATADLVARMAQHGDGVMPSRTLEGAPTFAFFSRVPGTGWSFVVGVPEDDLRGGARLALAQAVGAVALMLLFGAGAALWSSRAVIASARQLSQSAQGLGSDAALDYRPAGVAELDAAGTALVDAAGRLRNANRVLSHEVAAAVDKARAAQEQAATHQRLEALGRLTGGVAHDVNNLLAVVSNNVALLKALPPHAPRDAPHTAIARAVQSGRALTQKLLAFARQRTQAASRLELVDWLPATLPLLRTAVPGTIAIDVTVAPGTPAVFVDAGEFELALLNLCVNAGHAMPQGGRVRIDAAPGTGDDAGRVAVAVQDSGTGIAPEVLPRVFEPFFTTKEQAGGSGLGLSQVYGFCTQAGGSVRVDSPPGEGARFVLLLPLAPAAAGPAAADPPGPPPPADALPVATLADTAMARTRAPQATPALEAPRGRLLYVEDNADLAAATQTLLEATGWTVVPAADGEQALAALAREAAFDIVLSDYVMPGSLTGLDLGLHVRATRPGLPFVLLTGYAAQAQQAVAAGFTVIHKPCTADELEAALAAARRPRA